jgi:hypothetical protein
LVVVVVVAMSMVVVAEQGHLLIPLKPSQPDHILQPLVQEVMEHPDPAAKEQAGIAHQFTI